MCDLYSWVAPTTGRLWCVATIWGECWPTLSLVCKTFGASFRPSFGTMPPVWAATRKPNVLTTASDQVHMCLALCHGKYSTCSFYVSICLCATAFERITRPLCDLQLKTEPTRLYKRAFANFEFRDLCFQFRNFQLVFLPVTCLYQRVRLFDNCNRCHQIHRINSYCVQCVPGILFLSIYSIIQ